MEALDNTLRLDEFRAAIWIRINLAAAVTILRQDVQDDVGAIETNCSSACCRRRRV